MLSGTKGREEMEATREIGKEDRNEIDRNGLQKMEATKKDEGVRKK